MWAGSVNAACFIREPPVCVRGGRQSLSRMFGEEKMLTEVSSVNGDVRFYGYIETGMNLEGIDRHQRLIRSCMEGGRLIPLADCVILLCKTLPTE
ncbi:hypothetical protein [Kushneria marisflavi]|uniref:YcaO cyclodehydratase C-terminal domain-containing protein n=2 Tax=Kushneria marisflavi TaxID=157779 RepID=A0A240UP55_9GAMM|nr:hypothetical protein B9H00_07145 [Kushneria marisflavi]